MLKIDITVQDRTLTVDNFFRITAGSVNDSFIRFHIEPGYGWDAMDITAVFARPEQKYYRAGIKPDVYYAIPAGAINKPGTIVLSLVGTKNGDTIMTSTTTTLTVERNGMSLVEGDIYPLDPDDEYDASAYAQYVALVNEAATRAELAAAKAESIARGGYTKAEADELFVKKENVVQHFDGEASLSDFRAGTNLSLTVKASMAANATVGNIDAPVVLDAIEAVTVNLESTDEGNDLTSSITYKGFKLRRLNDWMYDKLTINSKGAMKTTRIGVLRPGEHFGGWVNSCTYRVSLIDAPELNMTCMNDVISNIGNAVTCVCATHIDLVLPAGTELQQLNDVELWYPLKEEVIEAVSATALPSVPQGESNLTCSVVATDNTVTSAHFELSGELQTSTIVQRLEERITKLEEKLAELESV